MKYITFNATIIFKCDRQREDISGTKIKMSYEWFLPTTI